MSAYAGYVNEGPFLSELLGKPPSLVKVEHRQVGETLYEISYHFDWQATYDRGYCVYMNFPDVTE